MKYLIKLGKKLFPLNRSLTGEGNLKTLQLLKKELPNLKIKKFKSGKKVFDWKVPDEWNVKSAYIKDKYNKKIIDFKNNNLHLISYSQPKKIKISLRKLEKNLFFYKNQPKAIPYVTSYYKKYWGFCLTFNEFKKIKKKYKSSDLFEVKIDSSFNKKGNMHYGELVIPGRSKKEILLSSYICHPSMANNELSGPLILLALAKFFRKKRLKKTIRFIFVPETIGSIAYIHKNYNSLKKQVIGGYVATCIGDNKNYSYLQTKYGDRPSDVAALNSFADLKIKYKKFSFLTRGSDERQFNSPGVDLGIGSIMRTKYGHYKEYHTSLDNFKLVNSNGLMGGYKVIKLAVEYLLKYDEKININNRRSKGKKPCSYFLCEPNLGKRGLYNLISSKEKNLNFKGRKLLDFLQYADGTNDIKQISRYIKLSLTRTKKIYKILKKNRLLN